MAGEEAIVVDTSAVAAIVFNEPDAEAVLRRIGDRRLVAPSLLPYELGNVLVVKTRRYPDLADELGQAFSFFEMLDVQLVDVPGEDAARLALETQLTAYDAAYLFLARQLDVDLVTLDRKLGRAER
jgi:predicted nucleic acid-binding protein